MRILELLLIRIGDYAPTVLVVLGTIIALYVLGTNPTYAVP